MKRMALLLCICIVIFALLQGLSSVAAENSATKGTNKRSVTVPPSKVKLYGRVDEVAYALAAAGVTLDADKLPALIGNVRAGSPAYYGGLAEEDKVLAGKIADNKLFLTIERGGKKYALSLNTGPIDLTKQIATPVESVPMLKVPQRVAPEVETSPEEKLSQYDLVVVIDTSRSMGYELSSVNQTKWLWCTQYVENFAVKMRKYLKGGITVVTFNRSFTIQHGCSPDKVAEIFKTQVPDGGTNLSAPLRQVLYDYLSGPRSHPLLVAVLTDGMPNLGEPVENVIKEATQQMRSPQEIRMTFLEIGEEYDGEALIKLLDDYLVHDGAKYDIVDSLTFRELKKTGLADALVRALSEKSSVVAKGDALEEELAKLKQQIAVQREALNQPQEHGKGPGRRRR